MDESKFQMWRATVGLVYVDGILSPEEKRWLDKHLKDQPFSDEQKAQIERDIHEGCQIDEILPKVTDKKDRSHLLHFANILFRSDNQYSPEEKEFFKNLEEEILQGIQLHKVRSRIASVKTLKKSKNEPVTLKVKDAFQNFMSIIQDKLI